MKVNPADIATRGRTVEELISDKLWWEGPPSLSQSTDPWPSIAEKPEIRLEKTISLTTSHAIDVDSWYIEKFSSLSLLIGVTVQIIRFINKLSKNYEEKLEFKFICDQTRAKETRTALLLLCKITCK